MTAVGAWVSEIPLSEAGLPPLPGGRGRERGGLGVSEPAGGRPSAPRSRPPSPPPQAGACRSWSPRGTRPSRLGGRPASAARSARRCPWARPPGT